VCSSDLLQVPVLFIFQLVLMLAQDTSEEEVLR